MSEQSKEFPAVWVQRLFSRFRAIYGNRATTMWGEVDHEEVMQAWSAELIGTEPEDVRMAFESMRFAYKDYPPTLFEFVALCRDARARRAQTVQKLPLYPLPTDARILGELAALVRHMKAGSKDPRNWARKILRRIEDGEQVPEISARFAREALGISA